MKGNFNVDEAFFIIDSTNLEKVETKFYGYCVTEQGIIENIEDLEDKEIKPEGAYIYIYKSGNEITIKQDYIGAYGLYLYRNENYFAISNSFLYLVDYIKRQKEYRITFNKKYSDAFITADLCSYVYSETLVNEIGLLDRNVEVNIDIKNKSLEIFYNDYEENTIDIDSKEGIDLLDKWYYKWSKILYNLKMNNCNIMADLSGGFDSRIVFNVLLGSKCNLNEIFINSIDDTKHTHKEDYEIAKAISEYYNFTLNNKNNIKGKYYNYNIDDILNISFYLKAGFHKQFHFKHSCMLPKRYYLGGNGGECIRSYWNISREDFIKRQVNRCKQICSGSDFDIFAESVKSITQKSFEGIKEKFELLSRKIYLEDESFNLYRETRCRNHFGKDMVENLFAGTIRLCPLIDSDLYKLKLNTLECKDKNLLMALIFVRYNEKLLDFKFEGHRCIDKLTLKYAQKINDEFPIAKREISLVKNFCSFDKLGQYFNNIDSVSNVSSNDISNLLLDSFNSNEIKNNFLIYYTKILYKNLYDDIKIRNYQPLQNVYVIIAISKIIHDIQINKNFEFNYFSDFIEEQQESTQPVYFRDSYIRWDKNLDKYITARIDIKNTRNSIFRENDIEIISISDNGAVILTPEWFHKDGKGYVIESQMGILNIVFKCIGKGELNINLRGKDVRNKLNQRIPVWIDYKKFFINDKKVLDEMKPAWHNEPLRYNYEVNDGDIISLLAEWQVHDFNI